MGLGLLYDGIQMDAGQRILSTTHDHYATMRALDLRNRRDGVIVDRISLYEAPNTVNAGDVVRRLRAAILPATRCMAITWVHSETGVKLPLSSIASMVDSINRTRKESQRIVLCVDGVHALGVEEFNLSRLGCDFFVAGTHKWLFGPRGTGLVWGKEAAWSLVRPIIPSFSPGMALGGAHTPGGFHSFEHRWALHEAFMMHMRLGKRAITQRTANLNQRLKMGLKVMPQILLDTPLDEMSSSGFVCFRVKGVEPHVVAKQLALRGIISANSWSDPVRVRIAGSLLVDEHHIDRALQAIARL
jgi:selenocysteine lyase/cysteine desulfurase